MKKPKKAGRAQQIKSTDSAMSLAVRLGAANDQGMCKCVTCDHWYPWRQIQNGHFISKTCKRLRWTRRNTAPQCARCNKWGQGMPVEYEDYLISEQILTPEEVQEWKDMKLNSVWKPPMDMMRELEIIFLLEAEDHATQGGRLEELNAKELARIRRAHKDLQLTQEQCQED